MKYGLSESTIEKIQKILAQFAEIDTAIIYGSRAMGTNRNGSDIDLTLKGKKIKLSILNNVSSKIDELNLPYLFDLSIYSQIDNPELIEHIKKAGKIFYNK